MFTIETSVEQGKLCVCPKDVSRGQGRGIYLRYFSGEVKGNIFVDEFILEKHTQLVNS